jgi:hypothetical protein
MYKLVERKMWGTLFLMHVCTVYTTNRVIYIVVYLRLCPLTLHIMWNEIKKKDIDLSEVE